METTIPRPAVTLLDRTSIDYRMFRRLINNTPENDRLDAETAETDYAVDSYRSFTQLRGLSSAEVDVTITFRQSVKPISAKEHFRALAKRLCEEHPNICTDKGIFGGVPHIKNVRLAVTDVLAQLYMLGSIDAVVNYYSSDINEAQIKEAVAYAHDFMEMACDPQSHETNGGL